MTQLIRLPANQPAARFYRGGDRIAAFRGAGTSEPYTPEDWVGSTTSVRGQGPVGQTVLPDGRWLKEAIAADPEWWLGPDHVAAFGADPNLLVKLLDAGQRLPVHAHPHRDFAALHLGEAHGKAEAWYILSPGTVWLGLRADLDANDLRSIVAEQRAGELLELMHRVEVDVGDSVYVPPGVLHAIGDGILLAEVQEPTDLSILVEWEGYALDGAAEGHLGLGFDRALEAVDRRGVDVERLIVRGGGPGSVLSADADPYFRLDVGPLEVPAGFAVLIDPGEGTTTLVPFAAGPQSVGTRTLVARPPLPAG